MNSAAWRRTEARIRVIFNDVVTEVRHRNWNEPLKPWSDFFERFTTPQNDLQVIAHRAIINSHIYQTNYCLIAGTALLLYVLFHPTSIFVLGAIIVAFVYTTSPTPLVINGNRITRRDRHRAFFIVSLLLLVVTGVLMSFLKVSSLCFSVVLLHACCRHTNALHKVSHFRNQPPDAW